MSELFRRVVSWVGILGVISLWMAACGDAGERREGFGEADRLLRSRCALNLPGAALVVVLDGKIIYSRGYGRANMEHPADITPQTVFNVGSLAKQFTAFSLLLLERRGVLSLDDDIRKYLPEMPDFGRPITIRSLLWHVSGLRDHWPLLAMSGWFGDESATYSQILDILRRQRTLNFEPGTEFQYSNSGYILGAEIVARVSGEPFPEWMRRNVFRPLGMKNTRFIGGKGEIVQNRAVSYYRDEKGRLNGSFLMTDGTPGAAGLLTDADDLARWMLNFDCPDVGDHGLMQSLWRSGRLSDGEKTGYGMGFYTGKFRGLPVVYHGGSDASFRSYMMYFPGRRLGVAVLSNYSLIGSQQLANEIAAIFLNQPPAPSNGGGSPEILRAIPPDPARFDALKGVYRLDGGDLVTLSREENKLYIEADGHPRMQIHPLSSMEYFVRIANIRIRFPVNSAAGLSAQKLILTVDGRSREGVRIEKIILTEGLMAEYEGEYISRELDAHYSIRRRAGKLIAFHPRHGVIALESGLPNEFVGDRWFFHYLTFSRDSGGQIDGFYLTGSRARHVFFRKWRNQP